MLIGTFYRLAAVWCGAAVMAFELTGARLLMPAFGAGIDTWSAAIAVTLGALALGYGLGGLAADAWPTPRGLGIVLLLAAAGLGLVRLAGHSLVVWSFDRSPTAGCWLAAPLVLAGPLLLLGMVQPLLVRLTVRRAEESGRTVGGLLAAGTVGGLVGTIATALVAIPEIGVRATLVILAVATAAVAVTALLLGRVRGAATIALMVGAVVAGLAWRERTAPARGFGPTAGVLAHEEGFHADLDVIERHGSRFLLMNGVVQTELPLDSPAGGTSQLVASRDYLGLLPGFRPAARTVLLIGVAGGLHATTFQAEGMEVRGVEIEPAAVKLAAEYFGLAAEVVVADGRAWLRRDERRYDAIVLDAFLGGSAPEHLYTREAFALMRDRLAPRGILAIHLIDRPQGEIVRAVAATLEAGFAHVRAARSGSADEIQPIYLFASGAPLTLRNRLALSALGFTGDALFRIETRGCRVLTDDCTDLARRGRRVVAAVRRHLLRN